MAEKVSQKLSVLDSHFAYLRLQKGKLEPFARQRLHWHQLYEEDLWRSYVEMRPHLPERCWALLDIGSGLGGIDVLLSRHYGTQPFLNLLDGIDDPPEMRVHRETFSSERVARDFMRVNGVRSDRVIYYGPNATAGDLAKPYDLVLSLGSWCFHYEPNEYLPRLLVGGGLGVGARLIVDLRAGKSEWAAQLAGAGFRAVAIIRDEQKYQRIVMDRAWTPLP